MATFWTCVECCELADPGDCCEHLDEALCHACALSRCARCRSDAADHVAATAAEERRREQGWGW